MNVFPDTMHTCPRFGKCKAPVCPLDPHRENCERLRGETKCTISRELIALLRQKYGDAQHEHLALG